VDRISSILKAEKQVATPEPVFDKEREKFREGGGIHISPDTNPVLGFQKIMETESEGKER